MDSPYKTFQDTRNIKCLSCSPDVSKPFGRWCVRYGGRVWLRGQALDLGRPQGELPAGKKNPEQQRDTPRGSEEPGRSAVAEETTPLSAPPCDLP